MDFISAFDKLMVSEGGYSNSPSDPGGETMWGITARVAAQEGYTGPMRLLPKEFAQGVARRRYWDAVRCEDMPPALRYPLFDAAYNSGPTQAVKWLQRAVGVGEDGIIGPMTLAAASRQAEKAAVLMTVERIDFQTSLPTWGAFGKGWTRRNAAVLKEICSAMD